MAVHEAELTYQTDGQEVPARISIPSEASAVPGVLLCAGRLREIDGLWFLARALSDHGMAVLATQYRGMDMRTDDRDCAAGLDYLQRRSEVDPERIAMVGHSRGAMASLRMAAKDDRVRSVVALQPVTDLGGYVKATRDYAPLRYERLAQGLDGSPEQQPETYAELSPLNLADRIRVPVLLVAGTMDLHSPMEHSMWMRDALVAAGNRDVQLESLDGVGHFFERMYSGYAHDTISDLTVSWLARTLAQEPAAAGGVPAAGERSRR
jgi:dipeptidyl aminopeptidase/acylaminoacyl peptidase